MSLKIELDTKALMKGLNGLAAGIDKATRPAAQAGAQVLYDEVRARVPVSRQGHWFYGTASKNAPKGQKRQHAYWYDAGSLKKAIYQKHLPERSVNGSQWYAISWRHSRGAQNSVPYGFMVEFGTSRMPAKPFLRPAYQAKHQAAAERMRDVFVERVKGGG